MKKEIVKIFLKRIHRASLAETRWQACWEPHLPYACEWDQKKGKVAQTGRFEVDSATKASTAELTPRLMPMWPNPLARICLAFGFCQNLATVSA